MTINNSEIYRFRKLVKGNFTRGLYAYGDYLYAFSGNAIYRKKCAHTDHVVRFPIPKSAKGESLGVNENMSEFASDADLTELVQKFDSAFSSPVIGETTVDGKELKNVCKMAKVCRDDYCAIIALSARDGRLDAGAWNGETDWNVSFFTEVSDSGTMQGDIVVGLDFVSVLQGKTDCKIGYKRFWKDTCLFIESDGTEAVIMPLESEKYEKIFAEVLGRKFVSARARSADIEAESVPVARDKPKAKKPRAEPSRFVKTKYGVVLRKYASLLNKAA